MIFAGAHLAADNSTTTPLWLSLLIGLGAGALTLLGVLLTLMVNSRREMRRSVVETMRISTDRYSKAVEQLGNDQLIVRLGGIYALESLMADSDRDQPTILEVLAAWIRERTTSVTPVPKKLANDVQAALTVIGRRTPVANERPIDLRWAVLDGASLIRAHLENADLTGAHLENADLTGAHLENADLTGAHLDGASLIRAHLEDADLNGAHLEGAHLTGAYLENAHLNVAHLEDADLNGAHLENGRLNGAYFENADLTRAHLENADLTEARLDGAHLTGARLDGADLGYAYLDGADLGGADLSSARSLVQSQLDGSIVDVETKLPEGLRPPGEPPPADG